MKILILDNYDSFTYNLFHIVEDLLGNKDILEVFRNDQISLDAVGAYNKIIISPGPGLPEEAGIITDLIRRYVLLGVAIPTRVVKTDALLFSNCPELFETGRYHSWVPDKKSFPHCLEITAIDPSGNIMGLQHKTLDVHGVQFHPESVLTKVGRQILKNWVLG